MGGIVMSKAVEEAFEKLCNEEIAKLPKEATREDRRELAELLLGAFSAMSGRRMLLSERKRLAKKVGVKVNIISSKALISEMCVVQLEGALNDGTKYATRIFEKLTKDVDELEELLEKQRKKAKRTKKKINKRETALALQLFAVKELTERIEKAMKEIDKLKAEKRPVKTRYVETLEAIEKALTESALSSTKGCRK